MSDDILAGKIRQLTDGIAEINRRIRHWTEPPEPTIRSLESLDDEKREIWEAISEQLARLTLLVIELAQERHDCVFGLPSTEPPALAEGTKPKARRRK